MARTQKTTTAARNPKIILKSLSDAERAEALLDELCLDVDAVFGDKIIDAVDMETLGEIAKQLLIAGIRFEVR